MELFFIVGFMLVGFFVGYFTIQIISVVFKPKKKKDNPRD